jgi:RNA polymerase sigma factor (sigma-70 family)
MSLTPVADADLVARCRRGDQEAWSELVNRFSRYIYAITSRVYRLERHDAEDVFQEVFARTYEHLDELRDDGAVRPWIGTLARRLCVDRLRSASHQVELMEEPGDPNETEEMMEKLDDALMVQEGLRALSGECAEILDRFFCQDESYKTIGEALDLPPGTIASRISRCLAKFRRQLEGRKPRFQPSGT